MGDQTYRNTTTKTPSIPVAALFHELREDPLKLPCAGSGRGRKQHKWASTVWQWDFMAWLEQTWAASCTNLFFRPKQIHKTAFLRAFNTRPFFTSWPQSGLTCALHWIWQSRENIHSSSHVKQSSQHTKGRSRRTKSKTFHLCGHSISTTSSPQHFRTHVLNCC